MKCAQVTHLMRCSGAVQLAAAACSMDVLRVWGRYVLCLLLLLYGKSLVGNTCIVANLPLIRVQGGFFKNIFVLLGVPVTTLTSMMRLFLSRDD